MLVPHPAIHRAPPPAPAVEELRARLLDVVDGDTLHVELDGRRVTLRLACVDTEEKLSARPSRSPTKPGTVFGQETVRWAREVLAPRDGRDLELVLRFPDAESPGGDRREDAYGRLLCHVVLPGGEDFNLRLVREGRSPYFDKYGRCQLAHEALVSAQAEARRAGRGLWDPRTNRARTPGEPSAVRPYDRLLPWWDARARAIDTFRAEARARPGEVLSAEDPAGLAAALARTRGTPGARVTVFATIAHLDEAPGGALTVWLHGGSHDRALHVTLSVEERARLEPLLRSTIGEFRQNHLWVRGRLAGNARVARLEETEWVVAEPAFPPP